MQNDVRMFLNITPFFKKYYLFLSHAVSVMRVKLSSRFTDLNSYLFTFLLCCCLIMPIQTYAANLVNLSFTNQPDTASLTLTFDQSVTPKLSMHKNAPTLQIDLNAKNTLQGLPVNFNDNNLMQTLRVGKNGAESSSLLLDLRDISTAQVQVQNKGSRATAVITIAKANQNSGNVNQNTKNDNQVDSKQKAGGKQKVAAKENDPLGEFIAQNNKTGSSANTSVRDSSVASNTKQANNNDKKLDKPVNKTDNTKLSQNSDSKPTKNNSSSEPIRPPLKNSGRIVIAIDAGHGGKDPGAIGQGGNREKVIALAVSKKLEKLLRDDPMFTPVLTRTGDYYISVPARSDIARKQKANLLVSIHADAAPNKQARGASVWVLSNKRANSEMAGWLEKQEKQSELLGGAGDVLSGNEKDKYLSQAVLDLQFGHSQKVGYGSAQEVLKELGNIGKLHKKRPEHASLGVLRSPDIPSMLVEIGFISNPDEESQLASSAYQDKLAQAIYKGLKRYFQQHPQTVK